jgi:hypothetical protein
VLRRRFAFIAAVAGVLFAVYTLAQFSSWLTRKAHHAGTIHTWVGAVTLLIIAVVVGVAAFREMVRAPSVEALPVVLAALVAGCVAGVLISPFADGLHQPFTTGPGNFFQTVWLFLGAGLIGMALGAWAAMGLGRDYRSTALKRYASTKLAKPARSVRR